MGKIKRVVVNKHVVKANLKNDARDPVLSVQQSDSITYGNRVDIIHKGEVVATLMYRPEKPLKCGASVWLECRCDVEVDGRAV